MQPAQPNPADQIWINLLCPAQNYRGVCRQMLCGGSKDGACSLNGKPWAPVCVIPQSHPVTEYRRVLAADEAQARAHLQ